jgi:hypothetical protein
MPTALVSFIKPSSQSVQSTTYTVGEQSATFYSNPSPDGLQLQIRLNSTEIQPGGALTGQVSLLNTLGTNVSLTPNFSANPNIIRWDYVDAICGLSPVDHMFGYALFQGHYTPGNISEAGEPLMLAPPDLHLPCPNTMYAEAYIRSVNFAPKSYLAIVSANASFSDVFKAQPVKMEANVTTGRCFTEPYQESGTVFENGITMSYTTTELSFGCGADTSLHGYWTLPIDPSCSLTVNTNKTNIRPCNYHEFSIGSYTLVAEDLWNDTAYAYFHVAPIAGTLAACTAYYYSVLGQEYISVTNGTTYTSLTTTTISSVSAFTSTALVSETAGYATTTTVFKPPSAWEVVSCVYPSLITTSSSATAAACYGGTLPTNSSSLTTQTNRIVINVTQAFDSWNWKSLSTFTVGSYKFDLVGSQNSETTIYLEPQVFINVTDKQGKTQRTDMANLGSLNGNVWPPDLSGGPNALFGGHVTIQWLFPCNTHDVFLKVTTQ